MKLAAWCADKGLKEQAKAHYSLVTRIDPSRDAAWKHLGYKKYGNAWIKPEVAAAAKIEAARQKAADKHWKPRLEKLRDGLDSKDAARRAKAERGLADVTDPAAVPMIWTLFAQGAERHQVASVRLLGQIDGPSASSGIAVLAVFSPFPEVRRRSIEALTRRDPRDVVGRLIGLIQKPYKYTVRHVNGRESPGELFVEGERFNIQRIYENQSMTPNLARGRIFTPDVPFDPFNLRNIILATVPSYTTNPTADISANRVVSSYPFPISPQSIALAGKALAANPQNAPAILSQLINNPSNRFAPAGYWFYPTLPNRVSADVMVSNSGTQIGPMNQANIDVMERRLAAENAAAINQLRMTQNNPSNPLHQAAIINRLESNPANFQAGMAQGMIDAPQSQAIMRDQMIAFEIEAARQSTANLEQRLAMDVQFLDTLNDGINLCNDRTLPILEAITDNNYGADPEKWNSWWTDQLGYAYQSDVPTVKPTYTDIVIDAVNTTHRGSSCFAAGTVVRTIEGPRAIETIHVGDRVLSQGTSSGQLVFQPVVAIHHNAPAPTLRIAIGGETIVATGIHRFWKAAKGWTMARELKAGDRLRMIGGTATVQSVEPGKPQPVYNLDVAENRDFFVGTKGLLVHDFSFVLPVAAPFDQASEAGCANGCEPAAMILVKEVDMVCSILVCCALLVPQQGSETNGSAQASKDLAGYQAALAKAGRDPNAHVRLALWCEAHGLTAERLKHLSLAVLYDPSHTLARGLMGLVDFHGKWNRPDVIGDHARNDPARQAVIKEYIDRRARTPEKADAQMKLAAWCAENGLKEQATAHYSLVIQIDPSRDAAWKHLGYKRQANRWLKPEELAAARTEATRQKLADKHWRARLEKIRDAIDSKDITKRRKAETGLAEVTDPRAVPMVWALFVRASERHQVAAVQMLGQIDGPSASSGLAVLAVYSPLAEVRRRAIETLARRDPRDIMGRLIVLVRKPYKYQVRHVSGPGLPGELFVEGERFNIQRFYQNRLTAPVLSQGRIFSPDIAFDPFSGAT